MQKIIKGYPGSHGQVDGNARVILIAKDLDKLKNGDILVTRVTSPAWTPFIHIAKAIITDVGGALSHAAIISREYGIPSVVGTKIATKLIKNGMNIVVDGTKGIVILK